MAEDYGVENLDYGNEEAVDPNNQNGSKSLTPAKTGAEDFTGPSTTQTVQYEFKIMCAKGILMKDGSKLKILWVRGSQTIETGVKLLKSSTVYFQQKFSMKTQIETDALSGKHKPKESKLRLMRVWTQEEQEYLGEAKINLADYIDCADKTMNIVDLYDSQFPDAQLEFYITATKILGKEGRAGSVKGQNKMNADLAGGAHGALSTRNAFSQRLTNTLGKKIANMVEEQKNDRRKSIMEVLQEADDGDSRTIEQQQKTLEALKRDFKKQLQTKQSEIEEKVIQADRIKNKIKVEETKYQARYDALNDKLKHSMLSQDEQIASLQTELNSLEQKGNAVGESIEQMISQMPFQIDNALQQMLENRTEQIIERNRLDSMQADIQKAFAIDDY